MNTSALKWRTSSYSGSNGGECVEVAFDGDRVFIRDSKYTRNPVNDLAAQPIISMAMVEWPTFLDLVLSSNSGELSDGVSVSVNPEGGAAISDHGTTLSYTVAEWDAFVKGVAEWQFDHPRGGPPFASATTTR